MRIGIGAEPAVVNAISVAVLIREIDARKFEKDYAKSKLLEKWNWINFDAKNMFHDGVGAGTFKSVTGFNHYEKKKQ